MKQLKFFATLLLSLLAMAACTPPTPDEEPTPEPPTAYTAVAFGYADGVMTTTYCARSESVTTLAAQ
ncbi:MAG: hypothetical protein J6R74_03225 [Tidjanibacter sp.]|nr:hypothetical protein [Tidjanibacter sp.]